MLACLIRLKEKKIQNRGLEKQITHDPLLIMKERILESDLSEKMIIDISVPPSDSLKIVGTLFLVMLPAIICTPFNWVPFVWTFIVVGPFFLYFLYLGYFNPSNTLVFDRQAGTFSYSTWLHRKIKTVSFADAPFIIGRMKNRGAPVKYSIELIYEYGLLGYPFYGSYNLADILPRWSFLVWYMDKNRPLPPTEIFDPYRQADYMRRQNEGFPEPLYPSQIPIPSK